MSESNSKVNVCISCVTLWIDGTNYVSGKNCFSDACIISSISNPFDLMTTNSQSLKDLIDKYSNFRSILQIIRAEVTNVVSDWFERLAQTLKERKIVTQTFFDCEYERSTIDKHTVLSNEARSCIVPGSLLDTDYMNVNERSEKFLREWRLSSSILMCPVSIKSLSVNSDGTKYFLRDSETLTSWWSNVSSSLLRNRSYW